MKVIVYGQTRPPQIFLARAREIGQKNILEKSLKKEDKHSFLFCGHKMNIFQNKCYIKIVF